MTTRSLFWLMGPLGLLSATLSCTSDKPVKCIYSEPKKLTENAATMIPSSTLIGVGTNFVLAGLAQTAVGTTASWAPLSAIGVVQPASTITLIETPVIAPQVAVTSRVTPGDQLVVVYGIMNADLQIELRAVTQFLGEAQAAPISLKVLPKGLAVTDVRFAVGSSRTGLRALVAWGLANQPGTKIETLLLGANGVAVGTPLSFDAPDTWKCLQFVPSRTDWGLSFVRITPSSTGKPWFVIEEGRDNNNTLARYNVSLSTADVSCPVVAPSDRGYLISWQTMNGTWVSDYNIEKSAVSAEFVAGAVRFGDQSEQPPIAGVAAMGFDAAVTFGVKKGPQVWLFNAFGAHVGEELKLPAPSGSVGPISTWPLSNAFYATYREGTAPSAAEGPRWFMKVECPAN